MAAVSYYVVASSATSPRRPTRSGLEVDPATITAFAVIPVLLLVFIVVRSIRRRHTGEDHE